MPVVDQPQFCPACGSRVQEDAAYFFLRLIRTPLRDRYDLIVTLDVSGSNAGCVLGLGLDDIKQGADVTITNASGAVVANASLGPSRT